MKSDETSAVRCLPILNDNGSLLWNASLVALAYMQYPNDEYSASTMLDVLATEDNQYSRVGKFFHTEAEDRAGRAKAAGEVARCLVELEANGFPCSLRRAYALVQMSAEGTKFQYRTTMPSGISNIRAGFQEFKDVAHFWAAASTMAEGFEKISEDEGALREFFALAAWFYRAMLTLPNPPIQNWSPWLVPPALERRDLSLGVPRWSDEFAKHARTYTTRGGN